MDKKLNPLDGEIDLLGDTVSDIIRKLNPLTGRLELVYSADTYIQKINPFIGDFDMVGGTGASYIVKEATGNGYINLTNAVANHLMQFKAYGGTINSDVPSGYTQLDYITLNKGYFDTGITPTTDTDYELKFTIAQNNTTQGVMGMLNNSTPTNNFYFMISSGNKFLSALGTSAITLTGLADAVANTDYIAKVNGETLTVNGVEATNFNRGTLEATQTIDLGCRKNSENNGLTGKFYYFKIWKGGILVAHYIPCKRNSDDVLGYYDIVNDTFGVLLTSYGTPVAGSSTLIPTPDVPIALTCNNGKYGYKVLSDNKFDTDHNLIDLGHYYTANGGVYSDSATNFIMTKKIPVTPGVKYVFYGRQKEGNRMSSYNRIHFFAEDGTFLSTGTYPMNQIGVGTAPANASYAILSCNASGESAATGTPCTLEYIDSYNWTFKAGNSEGTWEPFVGGLGFYGTVETIEDELGNTATAENLFSIGDIKDEQEILSGGITRNVGILVLDGVTAGKKIGTAWNSTYKRGSFAVSDMASTASSVSDAISSHFEYSSSIYGAPTTNGFCTNSGSIFISFLGLDNITSAETANQWLADQYVAGTPVVVVYPLVTPTTETVIRQTMNIQDGSNTIEITQASIDNLGLYAKYKATA